MRPGDVQTVEAGEVAAPGDGLTPLCDALLAAARAEAERILASADQTARDVVGRAWEQVGALQAEGRARDEADSADLVAAERAEAGRQARAIVLAAERAEYEALRAAARAAVAGLPDEPEYQVVRRRAAGTLRRLLGDEAQVRDANDGGLTATTPGRTADVSLVRLADRAVDTVLAETGGSPDPGVQR